MSYTHSFIGFTPPVRYDGDPWTQARIEESAEIDGTYAEVETIELDPVDDDATQPASRNFTTDEASLEEGWFRIIFLDADDQESPHSDPVYSPAGVTHSWQPSVADVAALIRARTKDSSMNEAGTFTANTRPTANQVASLITQATTRVSASNGAVSTALEPQASYAASLYAAMLVELSYFPEQVGSSQSPYEELKALFNEALASLHDASIDDTPGVKGIYSVPLRGDTYPETS